MLKFEFEDEISCLPFRWVRDALEAHCNERRWKFVSGSTSFCLVRQKSITIMEKHRIKEVLPSQNITLKRRCLNFVM